MDINQIFTKSMTDSSPHILRINPFDDQNAIRQVFEEHKRFSAERYKNESARRLYMALYTLSFEAEKDFTYDTINTLESLDKTLCEGDKTQTFFLLRKLFNKTKEEYFFNYGKLREVQEKLTEEDLECMRLFSEIIEEKIENIKIKQIK